MQFIGSLVKMVTKVHKTMEFLEEYYLLGYNAM
jgi:hypothetical protein